MCLEASREHAHLGNFKEQEAIYEQQEVGREITVELFEDQEEYGNEIDVMRTKNVMDGRRSSWPVLHCSGRLRSRASRTNTGVQMGITFLFHAIPLHGSKIKEKSCTSSPSGNCGFMLIQRPSFTTLASVQRKSKRSHQDSRPSEVTQSPTIKKQRERRKLSRESTSRSLVLLPITKAIFPSVVRPC